MQRLQLKISGRVQGVGFRPYIYQLAQQNQLTGFIYNDADGVYIEVQGELASLVRFEESLSRQLPPLAIIENIRRKVIACVYAENTFFIKQSEQHIKHTEVPVDTAICADCVAELFTRTNCYYHYPFINCTNCGPRYTLINAMPYDRQQTSMAHFSLCSDCISAYNDPMNRRYHAQIISCDKCGPQLSHSPQALAQVISSGGLVAIKSIGGYQFVCDANSQFAVERLQALKQRNDKPFALMLLNIASIKQFATLSEKEKAVLLSQERPIVLLNKKSKAQFQQTSKGLSSLGMMLPYTALHYLLFYHLLNCPKNSAWLTAKNDYALIVTSGNLPNDPICVNDDIAHIAFEKKINKVVSYNREIIRAIDDSVVRIIQDQTVYMRRARGYVPLVIDLPFEIPSILALGAFLKNTICLTKGNKAYLSPYIGSLSSKNTIKRYQQTIDAMMHLLNIQPEYVACDLHPDYYSSHYAEQLALPMIKVQHHHAHLAACAVDNGYTENTLGLVLDGHGLGIDGNLWGGELFYLQENTCERIGHLKYLIQPSGDKAVEQPWRMASSILAALNKEADIEKKYGHYSAAKYLRQLLTQSNDMPITSSCGRLFDAASALLGVCEISTYEGQAAMLLESLVTETKVMEQGWHIREGVLDLLPLFQALLVCDSQQAGANLFHGTLIAALTAWAEQAANKYQCDTIMLSGGCLQNKVLACGLMKRLREKGLKPCMHQHSPPNDGGLSLGQAWLAGLKVMEREKCV